MKPRYSIFSLARNAMNYHKDWERAWRSPTPKKEYDAVIVGAGGHGLATAYYLAKNHGITNVAVIEKSYIGSGNVGRNTTLIRSNYMIGGNTAFFEHSLKLWEGLSHELNFNCMVSQRGQIVLRTRVARQVTLARKRVCKPHRRQKSWWPTSPALSQLMPMATPEHHLRCLRSTAPSK